MKAPRVDLVCVGTELLTGKVNTHTAALAQRLEAVGLSLSRETSVSDDAAEMRRAFSEAWQRCDVVLCTGGLGPTFDDITRDVWARALGRRLRFVPALLDDIREKFRRTGRRMPPENRRQAYVLEGARVLANERGTAPGQLLVRGRKSLAILPGPAGELFPMLDRDVIPFLRARYAGAFRAARVYHFFGIPESAVDERLRPLVRREKSGRGVEVVWGILAHNYLVDVKVTASSADEARAKTRLASIDRAVRRLFGGDVFGEDADTLEGVLGRLLAGKGKTLALAESCTGGLLGEKVTRVPGSSAYFLQGFVTYSNESKRRLLGVKAATLRRFGAVSRPCALEMARGARKAAGADFALSVTGVAGPEGGTPEKPVGLVFIGLAGPRGADVLEKRFIGNREQVRERAALSALDLLRRKLLEGKL